MSWASDLGKFFLNEFRPPLQSDCFVQRKPKSCQQLRMKLEGCYAASRQNNLVYTVCCLFHFWKWSKVFVLEAPNWPSQQQRPVRTPRQKLSYFKNETHKENLHRQRHQDKRLLMRRQTFPKGQKFCTTMGKQKGFRDTTCQLDGMPLYFQVALPERQAPQFHLQTIFVLSDIYQDQTAWALSVWDVVVGLSPNVRTFSESALGTGQSAWPRWAMMQVRHHSTTRFIQLTFITFISVL